VPTRNVNLTAEQDAFVEEAVRTGRYQNASEAVRDAVRGLQLRHQQDELKLAVLQAHVEAGAAALERGQFTQVEDADLDAYFDDLAAAR
jgi:antitoxin ParD1/3/4